MPQIPLPGRGLQANGSPALGAPGVMAEPDVTGQQTQQLGGALTQFGGGLARAAGYLEDAAADAEADESLALYSELQQKDLEGEKGFLTLVGRDAVVGVDAARKQLRTRRSEVEAGIKNPLAREMFSQKVRGLELEAVSRIDRHHAHSVHAYKAGGLKARLEMGVQRFRATIQDPPPANGQPPRASVYREVAVRTAGELSDHLGHSPEQRQQLLLDTTTKMHAGVVEDLLANGRADHAKQYLEGAPAAEIEPDAAAQLQKLVRTATVNDEGVRLALQLMAPPPEKPKPSTNGAATEDPAARLQREEQERLLRLRGAHDELDRRFLAGEVSAEVRNRAIAEIRSMEADRRQDLAVRSEQVMAQVERFLAANPNTAPNALPADLQVAVDALGLHAQVNNFAENGRYATDPATWQELATVMAANPERLRQVTVEQLAAAYRGKLSTPYWNKLVEAHKDALAGKPSRVLEENERVLEAARAAGILPRGHGAEDAARSEDFFRFQVEVDRRLAMLGKPATPDELQAVLDAVGMDKVYRDVGGIFAADPLEVVSTLTADELKTAYVQVAEENVPLSAIPRRDVAEITEDLVAGGRQPTKQAIAEAWVAHYRGKK